MVQNKLIKLIYSLRWFLFRRFDAALLIFHFHLICYAYTLPLAIPQICSH